MKESEIKNVVNKMTKKFKNGGLIDCLRGGGKYTECKACGGRVEKGQDGGLVTDKHPYYRPNVLQSIFGAFSKNPQYPRYDGNGTYSGQIRPNGVQELEVKGPYGSYMQYTHPNGKIIIEDTRNGGVRYDHPESTKDSRFRKTAPADLVEMFQNVGTRFETPVQKNNNGGSVNTKKITKIEGLEKSHKLPNPPKKKTYVDNSKEWGKSQKVSKNQSKKN